MKGAIFIWRFGGEEGGDSCGRPKPEIKVRSKCIAYGFSATGARGGFVDNLWPFVHTLQLKFSINVTELRSVQF